MTAHVRIEPDNVTLDKVTDMHHIPVMDWQHSMKPSERRRFAQAQQKIAHHAAEASEWRGVQDRIRRAVRARLRRALEKGSNHA